MNHKVKKCELKTDFFCLICTKFYASQCSLCNHVKKFHKSNVLKSSENVLKSSENVLKSSEHFQKNYNCRKCNKLFNNVKTRWSHEKQCKEKTNISEENKLLKNEINELKNKINTLLKSNKIYPKTLHNNNNNNITNTQNNNITNTQNNNITNTHNNNINVTYVKFGSENMSKLLSEKEMKKILSQIRLSVEESIKTVHFNDNRPEYKNIFITNMRDNLAYIFNGKNFEAKTKDNVLTNLLNNHISNIESFIEEKEIEESSKNRHLFKFIREINGNDINKDVPNYKNFIINQIKQFIYNNSDKNLFKKLNKIKLIEALNTDNNIFS